MRPLGTFFAMMLAWSGVAFGQPAGQPDFRRQYDSSPFLRDAREFLHQSPLDWPAAEMREVAFARARTVIAEYDAWRARARLNEHLDRARRAFEASPQFLAARAAEEEAWNAYQQAVAAVIARLASHPEYVAYTQLADDLRKQIQQAKADAATAEWNVVPPSIHALAVARLNHARRASELRSAALTADAAVAEARARLLTAAERVRQLRADHEARTRDDERVLALRESLAQARAAAVAAAAYEDSARLIRRIAANYVAYLYRSDARVAFDPYDDFRRPWYYPRRYDRDATALIADPPAGTYGFTRR